MFDVLGVPVLVNVIIFGKIEEKKTTPTNTCLNRKCMNPDSRCLSRAAYSVKNTYQNLHQESDIWISKKKRSFETKVPDLGETLQGRWLLFCKKKGGPIRPPKNSHVYLLTRLVQKFRWPFFPDPVVIFFRIFTRRNPQLNSLRVTILHSYCWWKKSQTTTWDVSKKPVNNGITYLSLNWWSQDSFHQQ